MKIYRDDYMRFLRAPLLMQCKYGAVILIALMLLFGFKIESDLEVYIYTCFSVLIFRDLEESKYSINMMLPINNKFRLKMIYLNTYIIYICGTISSSINCRVVGQPRSLTVSIIIICLSVLLANIIYYQVCSVEFKDAIMSKVDKTLVVVTLWGVMIIYIRGFKLPEDIISHIIQMLDNRVQLRLVIVLMIGTVITTIVSYKHVEHVIRGK